MEVIVFDTNIFVSDRDPESAYWQNFRRYRQQSNCEVALPQVVLYELPRKLHLDDRYSGVHIERKSARLLADLKTAIDAGWQPYVEGGTLETESLFKILRQLKARHPKTESERLSELLQKLVGGSFRTLPMPSISHDELVKRCCIDEKKPFPTEQNQIPTVRDPSKGQRGNDRAKDSDRSYRDALIWFSILDEAVRLKEKQLRLVFVSLNVNDFADATKSQLHEHLVEDMTVREIAPESLSLCASMDNFITLADRSLEQERALQKELRSDQAFISALQLKARQLGEPLAQRFLDLSRKNGLLTSDMTIGLVSLLSIKSVKKFASSSDLSIKVRISVRGNLEFVLTTIPGGQPVQVGVHNMAQTISAGVIYNSTSKQITGTTIESSETDHVVESNIRITTFARENVYWTVGMENFAFTGTIRIDPNPVTFESFDELLLCLRDLDVPIGEALKQEGSRLFRAEAIPLMVLFQWGFIRQFAAWGDQDSHIAGGLSVYDG